MSIPLYCTVDHINIEVIQQFYNGQDPSHLQRRHLADHLICKRLTILYNMNDHINVEMIQQLDNGQDPSRLQCRHFANLVI